MKPSNAASLLGKLSQKARKRTSEEMSRIVRIRWDKEKKKIPNNNTNVSKEN